MAARKNMFFKKGAKVDENAFGCEPVELDESVLSKISGGGILDCLETMDLSFEFMANTAILSKENLSQSAAADAPILLFG